MELWRKLTEPARQAVVNAHKEAERRHTQVIGTGHLLLGVLMVDDGTGAQVLKLFGVDTGALRLDLERGMEGGEETPSSGGSELHAGCARGNEPGVD